MKVTKKQFFIGSLIVAGIVGIVLYVKAGNDDKNESKSGDESISGDVVASSKSRKINFTR